MRVTDLYDVNGHVIKEGDLIATGTVGEVIWDGTAVVKKRPVGRVVILSTETKNVYSQNDINIVQVEYGLAHFIDNTNSLRKLADKDGNMKLYLNTYDGIFQFDTNSVLEIVDHLN